jgi:DNA-binding MarR family transcriptional regulator
MPLLMLKDLPRYECLLGAAGKFPGLDPGTFVAFLNLLRTGDEVFEAEGEYLSGHHISHGRFMVLMLLQRPCDEPCTPASLAGESRVSRATMTGLIDTLEKDGLVVRKADKNDRRTVHVNLTPGGKSFINKIAPGYFRRVSSILEPLKETERKQLVRLLQKIQKGLVSEN